MATPHQKKPDRAPAPPTSFKPPPLADVGGVLPPPGSPPAARPDLAQGVNEIRERRERSDKGRPRGPRVKPLDDGESELSEKEVAASLKSLWAFVAVLAGWWNHDTDDLTDDEARDGARAWMPVVRRVAWLAGMFLWLAGPAWLAGMLRTHLHRRKAKLAEIRPAAPEPRPASVELAPELQGGA